jgi:predicted permease
MSNFIIIFFAFTFGLACKRIKKFPADTGYVLNLFVIYVSLPALILTKFPPLLNETNFNGHWWVPVSMAWISFLLTWFIITSLAKKYSWSDAKTGALILTAGLGNTSFVGFPLLEALLGSEAISVGILADQPGSFLVLSTLGVFVASKYSGQASTAKIMMRRIFLFPPFIAMIIAVAWTLIGQPGWDHLNEPLSKMATTLVPLALFAVGFQTQFNRSVIQRRACPLKIGLILKLVFMPLFFLILYRYIFGINDFFSRVTILESAMAVQISSAVVAAEFKLDTELANLMVGLSIPISLFTVPLWNWLLF